MNLKNLTLLLFAIFALQSCDNSDAYFGAGDGTPEPPTFSRLADIIKFDNVPADSLSFNPTEDSEVESPFGVKIFLPGGNCTGSGSVNTIPEELFVVIKEYPTIPKMALGNVQTISNEELLVTGGNFWWKIVDADGNDYELVNPDIVTAEQPIILDMGDYTNQARYYEGEVILADGQEVLNWTLGSVGGENFMGQDSAGNNIFQYYGLDLGWVNCDALYDYPGDRTQFKAMLNTDAALQESEQMVLFIIDDFPSLVNLTTRDGEFFLTYENSIPVGISGTLVGIALDEESNLHIGSTAVTVAGDDEFEIDLTPGTIADFTNLVNQASN